jgi:hypothetical protein
MYFMRQLLTVFCILLSQISFSQDHYFNASHYGCNRLLHGMQELDQTKVVEFVEGKVPVELVIVEGMLQNNGGYTKNLLNLAPEEYKFFTSRPEILTKYKTHIKSLVDALDGDLDKYRSTTVVSNFRENDVQVITYIHFVNKRIIGFTHPVLKTEGFIKQSTIMESELEYARDNKLSIVLFGDDNGLDIRMKANSYSVPIFTRPISIKRYIPTMNLDLTKEFDPGKSTVGNFIPNSSKQVALGGNSIPDLPAWQNYYSRVDEIIRPHFNSRVESLNQFKEELLHGEQDFLLLIAHLKGSELYIGDEVVSLEAIKGWGKRIEPTTGKRVAVLFVCNGGNQEYKVGHLFFKKKVEPLSNILIENNYFDLVVAPDHTILESETFDLLPKILEKASIGKIGTIFKRWIPIVFKETFTSKYKS